MGLFSMTEQGTSSIALELLIRELKNARTERNLSLDDVSLLTKVKKNYLEKIEEGDFSFLPRVYIFTFIKEYALMMGVGNDEAFEQCKKELQLTCALKDYVSADKDVAKTETKPSQDANFRDVFQEVFRDVFRADFRKVFSEVSRGVFRDVRFSKSVVLLIIGIVLVVVAGLSLFRINHKVQSSAPHSSSPVTLPSPTGEDTVAVAEPISDPLMITGANKPGLKAVLLPSHPPAPHRVDSVPTSAPETNSNSREWGKNVSFLPSSKSSPYRKVLVVRLVEDYSWVKVIADDSAKVYPGGKFTKGQVLRYEARKMFWVNIGRPKYVELYLNGKKIPQTTERVLIIH